MLDHDGQEHEDRAMAEWARHAARREWFAIAAILSALAIAMMWVVCAGGGR